MSRAATPQQQSLQPTDSGQFFENTNTNWNTKFHTAHLLNTKFDTPEILNTKFNSVNPEHRTEHRNWKEKTHKEQNSVWKKLKDDNT